MKIDGLILIIIKCLVQIKKNSLKKEKIAERSLISETVSIDGTVNSSGAIDIAGLIKGPVFSKEVIIKETGSISGEVEADRVEISWTS